MVDDPLVLGPLLRYVDESTATIWVETAEAASVTVHAGDRDWSAPTFQVHGHHYALVVVRDLEPGTRTPYRVSVSERHVWPPEGGDFPPSVIPTLDPDRRAHVAFGSCRTSADHGPKGNRSHGVDALRALAFRLAGPEAGRWPDLMLFLGDQVYADETSDEMREFISSRRDVDVPPGTELKDYQEYAHLYQLAWTEPANRWLLSTLPSAMIFDDHDIRDDWNTSLTWKEQMNATPWWHRRIVSGLASYWVYQHIGNLSPFQRSEDKLWQQVEQHQGPDELDLTAALDDLAEHVDADPEAYRWSYRRDLGDARLIVLDTRAARVLQPRARRMLDPVETRWLDEQMVGGFAHLLVGTSLPFLLPAGLHHLEAWNEAVADGAWGRRWSRLGERIRQGVDLEHWAAFQTSFQEVARMAVEVADGRRGAAPKTVTFLSGDVHHSFVSEVAGRSHGARIVQAVCSPIRNPLPRVMRFATAFLAYAVAGAAGALVARTARVRRAPFRWRNLRGPWFDNMVAMLEDRDDGLEIRWHTGVVDDTDAPPRLELVDRMLLEPRTGDEVR
jgi:hypothetical protein